MDFTEASLIFKLLNKNHPNDFPPSPINMHLLLWGMNCGDSTDEMENISISSTSHFALIPISDFIWSQFHISIGRITIWKEETYQVEVVSLWGEKGPFIKIWSTVQSNSKHEVELLRFSSMMNCLTRNPTTDKQTNGWDHCGGISDKAVVPIQYWYSKIL